jgi:hypothetical protein
MRQPSVLAVKHQTNNDNHGDQAASGAACVVKLEGFTSFIECFVVLMTATLRQNCLVRRNSEFGTSGGFELSDERASVLYWYEWHKRRLRLRVS